MGSNTLPMGWAQPALPAAHVAAGTGQGPGLVMATSTADVAWSEGQTVTSPYPPCLCCQQPSAFPPAQPRPSTGDTPACPFVSILLSDAADSSQNCGSHILAHVYHTLPAPQGASVLPLSPPAPLLPCWQQQQGFQGGLAWLDPWGGRRAPSSCRLS